MSKKFEVRATIQPELRSRRTDETVLDFNKMVLYKVYSVKRCKILTLMSLHKKYI